jgi:hypothetical protein
MSSILPNNGIKNWQSLVAWLRYWLPWLLVIIALAYGMHRYFEYRNKELDKRIERLGNE